MSGQKIIIISDSDKHQQQLQQVLQFLNYDPVALNLSNMEEGIREIQSSLCCMISSSFVASSKTSLLQKLHSFAKEVPFITVSESSKNLETNPLIFDQVMIPLQQVQLNHVLHRCQTLSKQRQAGIDLEVSEALVGNSPAILNVRKLVSQAANSDVNVLILGESGSGKEVVAKCLHRGSKRHASPFVPVNCGAIPGELLESELFGHEKGAFTGAYTARKGRFELAKGGSIFLDEIGDMPLAMQVKLLRVLQEKYFEERRPDPEYGGGCLRPEACIQSNLLG